MSPDDDVEKLFSWLQTPDIRYREFAGAREVTDAVTTGQTRSNTAEDLRPAQDARLAVAELPRHDDQAAQNEPIAPPAAALHEPTPVAPTPVPPVTAAATPHTEPPPPASAKPDEQTSRPLDSVFDRLSGGRAGVRDPRASARNIPGLGPTSRRPR